MCLISRVDGCHHPSPQHWNSAQHWIILSRLCSKIHQSKDESEGRGCVTLAFVFLCCFVYLFVLVVHLFIYRGEFCCREEVLPDRCWWVAVREDFHFREDGVCLSGCHKPTGMCKNSLLSPCFFQGLHLQQTRLSDQVLNVSALFHHF